MILYVGLAMISLGLLITFLGLGEGTSGFKTMEMKLIGPSLVGCGVFFAVLRILFCTVRVSSVRIPYHQSTFFQRCQSGSLVLSDDIWMLSSPRS